jgi:hypothetical protein
VIWTVGSSTVGTGTTLSAGTVSKNQMVVCTVTANDGQEDGNSEYDSVTLLNTAPVVSAVSISPSSPTVGDPLTCNYTFVDDDNDGDMDMYVGNGVGEIWYYKNTGSTTMPVIEILSTFIGKVRALNRRFISNQGTTYQKIVLGAQAIAVIEVLLSKLLSRYLLHTILPS